LSIGCCGLRPGIKLARGVPGPSPKYFRRVTQRVTVAVRRRCTASSQVRPRWDQAFPCCSLLGSAAASAGRALRRLAAFRPSGAASRCPSEVGQALLRSTHWQNYFHAHLGSGWDDETPPCRIRWRAHDGALVASPRLNKRPKAWTGYSPLLSKSLSLLRASGRVRRWLMGRSRGWDPACPSSCHLTGWLVASRLARRAQARQSPRRCSRDTLFSSLTSDDDHFVAPARC